MRIVPEATGPTEHKLKKTRRELELEHKKQIIKMASIYLGFAERVASLDFEEQYQLAVTKIKSRGTPSKYLMLLETYTNLIREQKLTVNGKSFEEASAKLGLKQKLKLAKKLLGIDDGSAHNLKAKTSKKKRKAKPKRKPQSIRTLSGGLPSLGKRK